MISLYEASVENYKRVLDASIAILKKSEAHFLESAQDLEEQVNMKLAPDMLPFSFQVFSVRHHSLYAAQRGLLNGEFGPPKNLPETDYAGLIKVLEEARVELDAVSAEAINARSGEAVIFRMGSLELPFTTENFVQSFSLPNLYFHASTMYDMLRMKGAPLGKADFMGRMQIGLSK